VTASRLRVHALSISLDGYVAGPSQDVDHPLGLGGGQLHEWIFATRTFRRMTGSEGGGVGTDDDLFAAGFAGIGATIMGRNMFGPVRGAWTSPAWVGWWGDDPPFHHDVFVLTHFARPPLEMAGGTTFHFVTGGPERALELARAAAGGLDVRLGGGAEAIRAYLDLGLVDELHLALCPVLLGAGERILDGERAARTMACTSVLPSGPIIHVTLTRT
jgi:dihydrofolate reductase